MIVRKSQEGFPKTFAAISNSGHIELVVIKTDPVSEDAATAARAADDKSSIVMEIRAALNNN